MKLERRGTDLLCDFPQHSQKECPIVTPRPALLLSRDDAGRAIDRRRNVALPALCSAEGLAPGTSIVPVWKHALKLRRASWNSVGRPTNQPCRFSDGLRIGSSSGFPERAFVAFEPLEHILKGLLSGGRFVAKTLETIFKGIESHGCHFLDLAVHRSDWPFFVVTKRKLTDSLQEKSQQSCRVVVIFSVLRRGCHLIVPGGRRSCSSPGIE